MLRWIWRGSRGEGGNTRPFPLHRKELLPLRVLAVIALWDGEVLGSNCEERVPLGVQDLLAAAQGTEDSFHAQDFGAVDGLDVEVIAGQREDFLGCWAWNWGSTPRGWG
jgi:hypothetical protein